MAIIGMDIEAVRQLAGQMDAQAEQIAQLEAGLTQAIESTEWVGPDRDRFVGDWQGNHAAQLRAVAQSLRDAATAARNNAQQQADASGQ